MNDLQKCMLDIFKEFKKICDKNNIVYYGIDGTLIGAIRHKGFIPWDDDMDVCIKMEDYDRAISILEQQLPDYLELFKQENHLGFFSFFVKIVDKRTTFIEDEYKNYENAYMGVYLDIIPFVPIPNNKIKKSWFFIRAVFNFGMNYLIRRLNFKCLTTSYFLRKLNKIYRENIYQKNTKEYLMSTSFKWIIEKDLIDKRIEVDFEDTKIKISSTYDSYLRKIYGDYMKLPPKESQIRKHLGFIDLNRPYEYYVKKSHLIKNK